MDDQSHLVTRLQRSRLPPDSRQMLRAGHLNAHSSSSLPSFVTSSWMKTWGLLHRKLLTVPRSSTDFDWSNIAKEWCASNLLAGNVAAMTMTAKFSSRFICCFIDNKSCAFLS